jgi:hypothetical protein
MTESFSCIVYKASGSRAGISWTGPRNSLPFYNTRKDVFNCQLPTCRRIIGWLLYNDLGRILKETVVAYFKILLRHVFRGLSQCSRTEIWTWYRGAVFFLCYVLYVGLGSLVARISHTGKGGSVDGMPILCMGNVAPRTRPSVIGGQGLPTSLSSGTFTNVFLNLLSA